MPGLLKKMDSPVFLRSASLKSHKALPRRRVASAEKNPVAEIARRAGPTDHLATSPRSLDAATAAITRSTSPPFPHRSQYARGKDRPSGRVRAPRRSSDDTSPSMPDHTAATEGPAAWSPSSPLHRDQTTSRPSQSPAFSRQASSRAESFKTAREEFSEDDGEVLAADPTTPTLTERTEATPRNRHPSTMRTKQIGLGLGLESDDEAQTPTAPRRDPRREDGDETWSSKEHVGQVLEDPFIVSEPAAVRGVLDQNTTTEALEAATLFPPPTTVEHSTMLTPLVNGLALPERKASDDAQPRASLDRFAKAIGWPLDSPESEMEYDLLNHRRLSQASGASTVVEVLVLATPPRRQHTLRRAHRHSSLREAQPSAGGGSHRSSLGAERQPTPPSDTKTPEKGNRISFNSDSGVSMGSDSVAVRQDMASLAAAPLRQASLRSSKGLDISHLRRSTLQPSHSARPTTAPELRTVEAEAPVPKPRAVSDHINYPPLHRPKPPDVRPTIPARRSSLSAPTSRNASRATSLTSTSPHPPLLPTRRSSVQGPSPESHRRTITVDTHKPVGEEWLTLRPRSSLISPYSMTSYQSSTPGMHELNEATAMSIFPHHNQSVLVVQQLPPRATKRHGPNVANPGNGRDVPPQETGPLILESEHDAALSNPREAPQPPDVMVIPPTPLSTAREQSRASSERFRPLVPPSHGPLSKMRRALSARRYASSLPAQLARSLSNRQPTTARYSSSHERPKVSLSPFWQPRGFWDDLDGELAGEKPSHWATPPDRMPQRSTSLNLASLVSRSRFHSEHSRNPSQYGGPHDQQNPGFPLSPPRRNLSLHLPRLTVWQDRSEKKRAMHAALEEERRERDRAHLRKSIGPVILATTTGTRVN